MQALKSKGDAHQSSAANQDNSVGQTEVRRQETEVRGQKTGDRRQKSDGRGQRSEVVVRVQREEGGDFSSLADAEIVQQSLFVAPILFNFYEQFQVTAMAQQAFNVLPRLNPNLLQVRGAFADNDFLL